MDVTVHAYYGKVLQTRENAACIANIPSWYRGKDNPQYFTVKFIPEGDKNSGITDEDAVKGFETWMDILTETKLFKKRIYRYYINRYEYIFWFSDSFIYNKALLSFVRFGFEMKPELRSKILELLDSGEITEDQAIYIPALITNPSSDNENLWHLNNRGHNIVFNYYILQHTRFQVVKALSNFLEYFKTSGSLDSAELFHNLANSFKRCGDKWLDSKPSLTVSGWSTCTTIPEVISILRNMPNEL